MPAEFWTEAEARRARWDVLMHPFYENWAAGTLRSRELAIYASEYEHAVVAIARASAHAARLERGVLELHALEEESHISLWRSFAKRTGWGGWGAWGYGEEPLPTTVECAGVWEGDARRGLGEHLITLYAIEATQSQVSRVKLDGLLRYYGFEEGPATEYFRLHAKLDAEHARLMRSTLDPLLDRVDHDRLLDQTEAVQRAYWQLLDGVVALAERR